MQKYVLKHANAAHITRTEGDFTKTGFCGIVVVNMLFANYRPEHIAQTQQH